MKQRQRFVVCFDARGTMVVDARDAEEAEKLASLIGLDAEDVMIHGWEAAAYPA